MRTPNIGSVFYAPSEPPQDVSDINRFLVGELSQISAAINALAAGHLDVEHVAPVKPRDGDIRYADGTNWDPGSGVGVYYYKASAWVLLG